MNKYVKNIFADMCDVVVLVCDPYSWCIDEFVSVFQRAKMSTVLSLAIEEEETWRIQPSTP